MRCLASFPTRLRCRVKSIGRRTMRLAPVRSPPPSAMGSERGTFENGLMLGTERVVESQRRRLHGVERFTSHSTARLGAASSDRCRQPPLGEQQLAALPGLAPRPGRLFHYRQRLQRSARQGRYPRQRAWIGQRMVNGRARQVFPPNCQARNLTPPWHTSRAAALCPALPRFIQAALGPKAAGRRIQRPRQSHLRKYPSGPAGACGSAFA